MYNSESKHWVYDFDYVFTLGPYGELVGPPEVNDD